MADIFSIIDRAISLGFKIKNAFDMVQENKNECYGIVALVSTICGILDQLKKSGMVESPAMNLTLTGLDTSLENALTAVEDCQEKNIVRHLFSADEMSKRLRRIREDITQYMHVVSMAIGLYLITIVRDSRGRPSLPLPQELEEAYQALSGSTPYQSNNSDGDSSIPVEAINDLAKIFAMLFGSEVFADYIGQPMMVSMASLDATKQPKKMRVLQNEREEKLAEILKKTLHIYVEGNKTKFVRLAKDEVKRLSNEANGIDMLHSIGYVYLRQAAKELGKEAKYIGLPFLAEWLRNKGHRVKSHVIDSAGGKVLKHLQKYCLKPHDIKSSGFMQTNIHDMAYSLLKICLWKINIHDIETSLAHVCQMVLKDGNVSKEERHSRAKGLKILGKIFKCASLGAIKSYRQHEEHNEDAEGVELRHSTRSTDDNSSDSGGASTLWSDEDEDEDEEEERNFDPAGYEGDREN